MGEGRRVSAAWVSPRDGGKGVEIESAASQVMQIISFNLLLKITQSQVKEGLYALSHCYRRGVTDLGRIYRAAEGKEEVQQMLACWKCQEGGWLGGQGNLLGCPKESWAAGRVAASGLRSPCRDLVPGASNSEESLLHPPITLALLISLFLVLYSKHFTPINYSNRRSSAHQTHFTDEKKPLKG